ncbi:ABC transporter permease [Rothia sp. CCM 9418]|uniref:ABC transporter permease n=1 Tax=unclassified Rothia (in: high G+C Gram-positive bacteria) TaxID=2689056 RepID=UPI003ACB86FC
MSTTAVIDTATPQDTVLVRHWKNTWIFGTLSVISLLVLALNAPASRVVLGLSTKDDVIQLPALNLSTPTTGWAVTAVLIAVTLWCAKLTFSGKKTPLYLSAIFWFSFIFGVLIWAIGSARMTEISLITILTGAVALSVPMIFGSMGGLLCERSGIINIAIEGQLLFGAFSAVLVGSMTGNPWLGLIAAMIGGMLVSFLLATFSIKYLVDQTIVGVVVNVLVSGLTGFLYSRVLQQDAAHLNSAPRLPSFEIPVLSQIPVIGPVLFNQSVIVYLMYIVVGTIWFSLNKTRWGLRTRAVGEHPQAADTLGVNVNRLRFSNVMIAGAVAGMGGAFFTLVAVSSFNADMTAGQGYIALAALIFGRWKPLGALSASLLFGFSLQMQFILSGLGTDIPTELLAMLPYVVTILAVAGLVGRSRGPAAAGKAYTKG